MARQFVSRWLAVCMALLCALCIVPALAEGDADAKALKILQDKFRSQRTNDRSDVMRKVRELPTTEAAKFVVERGLRDRQSDVRNAAIDTLFALKNDATICAFLLDFVQQESARKQPSPDLPVAVAILFSSESPEPRRRAEEFLDKHLQSVEDAQSFLATLVDAWGRNASQESLSQLVRLVKNDLVSRHFGFQRAIIQSLTRFRDAAAVESLIGLLADVKGEVRLDIVRHLTGLTGKKLGVDAAAWQAWWRDNKTTFKPPAKYTLPAVESLTDGVAGSYYGLPLYAQRIVFVLDTSGSMRGLRLEAAKAELHKAIEGLPKSVAFSVVVFNSEVGIWQRQLVPATPEAKQNAHLFVAGQGAQAMTATYNALEAAFLFDAEAIYFLSDGAPTVGTIVRPAEIVTAVTRGNRGRLISIYTIGIGDELRGPSGAFMQQIAEQNFGVYRRVN